MRTGTAKTGTAKASSRGRTGIAGYVDNAVADALVARRKKTGTTDIRFEPGSDKIVFRIKNADIREVQKESSSGKESLVRIILAPQHKVETIVNALRDVKRLNDPTLSRLTARSSVSVSFV